MGRGGGGGGGGGGAGLILLCSSTYRVLGGTEPTQYRVPIIGQLVSGLVSPIPIPPFLSPSQHSVLLSHTN